MIFENITEEPFKRATYSDEYKIKCHLTNVLHSASASKDSGKTESFSIAVGAWTEKGYFSFNTWLGGEGLQTATFIAVHQVMKKCFKKWVCVMFSIC